MDNQSPLLVLEENKLTEQKPADFLKGKDTSFNDAMGKIHDMYTNMFDDCGIDENLRKEKDKEMLGELDDMYKDIMHPSKEQLVEQKKLEEKRVLQKPDYVNEYPKCYQKEKENKQVQQPQLQQQPVYYQVIPQQVVYEQTFIPQMQQTVQTVIPQQITKQAIFYQTNQLPSVAYGIPVQVNQPIQYVNNPQYINTVQSQQQLIDYGYPQLPTIQVVQPVQTEYLKNYDYPQNVETYEYAKFNF